MSRRTHKNDMPPESDPAAQTIERAEIADLAYRIWADKGFPMGTAELDWLEAEKELKNRLPAHATAGE